MWESLLQGAIGTGLSSAAGLLGGFMNRGLSQRDAMAAQNEFAMRAFRDQLKFGPRWEIMGLRNAGINPMLHYSKGHGGVNPNYALPAIAPPVNPGQFLPQGVEKGLSTAVDYMQTKSNIGKQAVEVQRLLAEIPQIEASTRLTDQQKEVAVAEARRIWADEQLKIAQSVLSSEEVKKLHANIDLIRSEIGINTWTEVYEKAHARMAELGIPIAEADAKFWASAYAQWLRAIEHTKDAINPFGGSGIGAPFQPRRK